MLMVDGLTARAFGADTSEERIAECVDAARPCAEDRIALLELLPEQTPLYSGRSTNQTVRIRGHILAAFERVGLPDEALPYVLEELESGQHAYLVAAAAKALRGSAKPSGPMAAFLLKAFENIRYADDAVTFESYKPRWPLAGHTTALTEIVESLSWLGMWAGNSLGEMERLYDECSEELTVGVRTELKKAIDRIRAGRARGQPDCCALPLPWGRPTRIPGDKRREGLITGITLEDQDGVETTFGDFFRDKPSIVVFFYSRCDNPNKCSLTVTKLAQLQQAMRLRGLEGQLRIAALTYDPLYDLPPRLKAFGLNRGVEFGEDVRFFRAPHRFEEMREYFDLGVNFVHSIVNRHRIEVYLLDDLGRIAATTTRMQWDVEDVLRQAAALLPLNSGRLAKVSQATSTPSAIISGTLSAVSPVMIAIIPKCPVCWAAYLSMVGISGLQKIPHSPLLLPILVAFVLGHLIVVLRRSRKTRRVGVFALSVVGVAALLAGRIIWDLPYVSFAGALVIIIGSFASNLLPSTDTSRVSPNIRAE